MLDVWAEQCHLWLADHGDDSTELAIRYAKEKLAEASVTLKASAAAAAGTALEYHLQYIRHAERAMQRRATAADPTLRYAFINGVLEHIYIASVDYVDLPLDIRAAQLESWFDTLLEAFTRQRAALSDADREALFFKEEEVRWSVEMTRQADAQRITNDP